LVELWLVFSLLSFFFFLSVFLLSVDMPLGGEPIFNVTEPPPLSDGIDRL
jgi:hypothetical protein